MQAKLDLIQKQLELVTSRLSKGKGRGKKSGPSQGRPSGLLNRLRTSISGQGTSQDIQGDQSDTTSVRSDSSEAPPPYSEVPLPNIGATKKTIYIQNVQLLLNGVPLDQIDTTETKGTSL